MAKAVTLVHNPQRTSGFIYDWGLSTVASATLFNRYRALCGLAQWVHIADHHSGCRFPPSGLPAELTQWRDALMYSDGGVELPKSLQVCGRMLKSRVAKREHARGFVSCLISKSRDLPWHHLHHTSCDYQWSHGGPRCSLPYLSAKSRVYYY